MRSPGPMYNSSIIPETCETIKIATPKNQNTFFMTVIVFLYSCIYFVKSSISFIKSLLRRDLRRSYSFLSASIGLLLTALCAGINAAKIQDAIKTDNALRAILKLTSGCLKKTSSGFQVERPEYKTHGFVTQLGCFFLRHVFNERSIQIILAFVVTIQDSQNI